MQLTLCDSCRRVVDPADLDGGRGARLGGKTYCADCVPGGPGRPSDVASCRDCQVTVAHAALTGGGEVDFGAHQVCVRCEKNPTRTPLQPHTVECSGCQQAIEVRDVRIGLALPVNGDVWCGECRKGVEDGDSRESRVESREPEAEVAAAPQPVPAPAAAPDPKPPSEPGPAEERGTRNAERITCDSCSRAITADELRSGAAAVVGGAMVCPRCRGRSARQTAQRKASTRYALSLAFVMVIFPLTSAGLAILIYRAVVDDGEPPARTATQRSTDTGPGATGGPAQPPQPGPAAGPSNDEFRLLFAEFMKAMAERERAEARRAAGPQTPPAQPVVPGKVQAAPDERPAPGPGAAIARDLKSDAVKRQLTRLDDTDPGVRLDAVLELAGLTADEATPALRKALEDGDPVVRSAAAKVAGKLEAGGLLDPLMKRLGDPEKNVRRSVAQALGKITKTQKWALFEDMTEDQLDALRREIAKRQKGSG